MTGSGRRGFPAHPTARRRRSTATARTPGASSCAPRSHVPAAVLLPHPGSRDVSTLGMKALAGCSGDGSMGREHVNGVGPPFENAARLWALLTRQSAAVPHRTTRQSAATLWHAPSTPRRRESDGSRRWPLLYTVARNPCSLGYPKIPSARDDHVLITQSHTHREKH